MRSLIVERGDLALNSNFHLGYSISLLAKSQSYLYNVVKMAEYTLAETNLNLPPHYMRYMGDVHFAELLEEIGQDLSQETLGAELMAIGRMGKQATRRTVAFNIESLHQTWPKSTTERNNMPYGDRQEAEAGLLERIVARRMLPPSRDASLKPMEKAQEHTKHDILPAVMMPDYYRGGAPVRFNPQSEPFFLLERSSHLSFVAISILMMLLA